MKLDISKENPMWPLAWGLVAVFFWAVALCSYSAVSGQLGTARGITIGPWLVGSISRYYDPFLLGVLVTFSIWAWKHGPPPMPWLERQEDKSSPYILAFLFGVCGFILSFVLLLGQKKDVSDLNIIFLFIGVMLLTPFGFRGMLAPFICIHIAFWICVGLTIVTIILPILYVGKWLIWWAVNIISFQSFDKAYNKLKGREVVMPPSNPGETSSASA